MTEPPSSTNLTPIRLPVSKPSSPLLTVILIILLAFSLGTTGFLYWQNQQLAQQLVLLTSKQITQPVTVEPTTAPTTTIDPTAGWKTYTNAKYNFEFKFPPEWSLKNENPTIDQHNNIPFRMSLTNNTKDHELDVEVYANSKDVPGLYSATAVTSRTTLIGTELAYVAIFPQGYENYGTDCQTTDCSFFAIPYKTNNTQYMIYGYGSIRSGNIDNLYS